MWSVLESLALYGSALSLGLLGGGHCWAMCGSCTALASPGVTRRWNTGRLLSYTLAGALLGGGAQWLAVGAARSGFLHSVWVLMQVAAGLLAVALLLAPHRVSWSALGGAEGWQVIRWVTKPGAAPTARGLAWGLAWAVFPCGLLHAAGALALLAGNALRGAGVMLAFALGTSVWLLGGQTVLRGLRASGTLKEDHVRRVAGASLLVVWLVLLWDIGPVKGGALWCVSPN